MLYIGDSVPDFTAIATLIGEIKRSDFAGQYLVLYFYPKDNTPGCTLEAQEFSARLPEFVAQRAVVLGVSRDTLKSHQNFQQKQSLSLQLIADTDASLCQLFDVIKEKNMYGKKVHGIERSTFLLDASGVLIHAWRKVKVPGHVDAVLATLIDKASP